MRIGIDIDDTIADSYEVAFAYAQRYTINELGRSGEIQNVVSKHHDYVNKMHNWSKDEEKNFWNKYYREMLPQFKPLTLVAETIQKLKKEGNEIIIVSARWPEEDFNVELATLEWLKSHHIVYDEIVLDASDKAKIAFDKKLDIFIDDSFKNCIELANAGVKTYIMETRTNKSLNAENITRVYSWPDIYDKIKKEEKI